MLEFPCHQPGARRRGKPSAVPRSQGFHERDQSSLASSTASLWTGSIVTLRSEGREATYSASPTANRPTATTDNVNAIEQLRVAKNQPGLPRQLIDANQTDGYAE